MEKLDQLSEFYSQRDLLSIEKARLLAEAMPEEVRQRMAEIEAEFSGKAEAVNENIAALEAEIKADVLTGGKTVKGATLMAVWSKGRVTWDAKSLDGFAVAHPEILYARKEGDPSVSIRKTG